MLVISSESLTPEQCLGFAALICDYVDIEFKDPKLQEEWDWNEKKAKEREKKEKKPRKRKSEGPKA